MTTMSEAPRANFLGTSFAGTDVLELLPDGLFDDLTDAINAFEPLSPLELVLEQVDTDPVLAPVPLPISEPVAATAAAATVIKQEPPATVSPPSFPLEDATQSTSTSTSTGQQRPPMKNPSRERLRAELKFLRQRVVEMERDLQTAKAQQQLQTRKRMAVKWDRVAHDEQRKRQRAEDVNSQLRSTLTKQTRIAKSLERLLQDQNGADAFARFCDTDTTSAMPRTPDSACDSAVLMRLEEEVIRAYATVDDVLRECKMDDAEVLYTSSHTEVKTTAESHGLAPPQILLELLDSKFVPFDFGRTCDAFWRALATPAVYLHHDVDMLVETGNTIRFKSRLPWHFNGEQRTLRCLIVIKRYTIADRMVIVWRGAMATENASTRAPWVAAGWEETCWIVVREIEPLASIASEPGSDMSNDHERPCVLQTITRHIPRWQTTATADATVSEREIGAFSSMVLTATEDDMAHVTSAMQSLLLAEVLDGVSAAAACEQ